jgi:hypothetical protein
MSVKSLKLGEEPPAGMRAVYITLSVYKGIAVPDSWGPLDVAKALENGKIDLLDEPQELELVGDSTDAVWTFEMGEATYDEHGSPMDPRDLIETMYDDIKREETASGE